MPPQSARARHAAPRETTRTRAALLPGVLLAAAGTAFAGLATFPASAADIAPRVTAASALQPVELAAPTTEAPANLALASALEQGLAASNAALAAAPKKKASRQRTPAAPEASADSESDEASGRLFVRPGLGRVTSPYGRRWGRLHAGVDLAAGMGAPIRAVTNATVTSAGWEGGYGKVIRLVAADGTAFVYAHLDSISVNDGERVSAGERIGREGNSGRSTGPHLHFEVRINGTPVNPITWLRKRDVAV